MENITNLAHSTLRVAYKNEKPQIVVTVLMIISIIVGVIGVIQRCQQNKEEDVVKRIRRRRPWDKRAIRRIMKEHLTEEQFNSEGKKILGGLLEVVKTAEDKEILSAYEEGTKKLSESWGLINYPMCSTAIPYYNLLRK